MGVVLPVENQFLNTKFALGNGLELSTSHAVDLTGHAHFTVPPDMRFIARYALHPNPNVARILSRSIGDVLSGRTPENPGRAWVVNLGLWRPQTQVWECLANKTGIVVTSRPADQLKDILSIWAVDEISGTPGIFNGNPPDYFDGMPQLSAVIYANCPDLIEQ
jgi:hypothetical protein